MLPVCRAAVIKNMEQSGGVLPIALEKTYLENAEHVLVHYYNIETLYEEYDRLVHNQDEYRTLVKRNRKLEEEVDEYLTMFDQTQGRLAIRFQNLVPKLTNKRRYKRGLINGLGTIIKAVTGNLDDDDRQRYEQILNEIKNKNSDLENQIKHQYSITESMIKSYNKTIANLNFNNNQIKAKMEDLNKLVNPTASTAATLKENIHHMILTLNILDQTVAEIETAYTFCKMGQLHPSIIPTAELQKEIDLVLNKTKTSTLSMIENILEYETLIDTHCTLADNRIIFLLNLPLYSYKEYTLYTIKPIPVRKGNEFITIVPKNEYYLYDKQNDFFTLRKMCSKINDKYFCNWDNICKGEARCEENIITKNQIADCEYSKFRVDKLITQKFVEINQMLITTPTEETIEIKNEDHEEIVKIKGSYLIKPENDEIYLNRELFLSQGTSSGKPYFMQIHLQEITEINIQNDTFQLKDYQELYLNNNDISWLHSQTVPKLMQIKDIVVVIITIIIIMYLMSPLTKRTYKTMLTKYRVSRLQENQQVAEPPVAEIRIQQPDPVAPVSTIPIFLPRAARD